MDAPSSQRRGAPREYPAGQPTEQRLRRRLILLSSLAGTLAVVAGAIYGPGGYRLELRDAEPSTPVVDLPFPGDESMITPGTADPKHLGFAEVAEAAGLTHTTARPDSHHQFGGVAVGDFFGNGLADLFFTRHDNTDIFYKNLGDGTFKDVTEDVFGPDLVKAPTNGALLADLNNNGHLDLYVTTSNGRRHYLYINDGNGRLVEQAVERGAALEEPEDNVTVGMSVTAGDFTGNHYLDLFVSDWRQRPAGASRSMRNRLLRNMYADRPGHFEDVTEQAGLDTPNNRWGFSGRFADMNRDGRMDLLAVNDYRASQYFRNEGDGTFTEVTAGMGVGTGHNEMGSTVADYNNNGYLDWFVTSIGDRSGNRLYRNEMHRGVEGLAFSDQTDLGVRQGYWGWGASFIDYNNNGLRDIVLTNGYRGDHPRYENRPMLFYQNEGPERNFAFTEIGEQLGVHDTGEGRVLVVADFFGTGFLDILVVNYLDRPRLYRNNGGRNKWLRINTVGEISHTQGIGALITVQPKLDEPHKLVHDVNLGATFLGHNEVTAHFGLGRLDGAVDYVHIQWPSGVEQEFFDIEPNHVLIIHETQGIVEQRSPASPVVAADRE